MPPIRSLASIHYILLATSISLNSEIMSPYSYYIKRGLVYIAIAALFNYQPSFCSKYIKINTHLLCNIYLIFTNEYIFGFYWCY